MGFRSGKLSLCTLCRDNFPGAKLSSHSVIMSISVINNTVHFGHALFSFFSAFCHTSDLN